MAYCSFFFFSLKCSSIRYLTFLDSWISCMFFHLTKNFLTHSFNTETHTLIYLFFFFLVLEAYCLEIFFFFFDIKNTHTHRESQIKIHIMLVRIVPSKFSCISFHTYIYIEKGIYIKCVYIKWQKISFFSLA